MVIVVMGPSGAGKSTVGALLAARRGVTFVDADDLHPEENVRKMASGTPLDEADRAGWLRVLAGAIDTWLAAGEDVVLACSALRVAHRDLLRRDPDRVRFVYLHASPAVLAARLQARRGHFMGPGLLPSQLVALEEPTDAMTIENDAPPDVVVDRIERALRGG